MRGSMTTTIRQLLRRKGHHVWSIRPGATVYEAIEQMATRRIGALLVMERNRVLGIITERDYARKCILEGRASQRTFVHEIMDGELVWAAPDMAVEECMALMTERRVRHMPVHEGEDLHGLVSIGDLVKERIADQQFVIEQLTLYVAS